MSNPIILGIETSCDETAVAILNGEKIAHLFSSQIEIHKQYGGIVPELACRSHIETIAPLYRKILSVSGCAQDQINAIAVTAGPGLVGALLVGVSFAKSLAYALRVPLLAVHHLEGHISAIFLEHEEVVFPAIALVVSGGHTNLYKMPQKGKYHLLGKTLDDAAGEALDKGARLLGYEYPGGPVMDRLSQKGDRMRYPFSTPNCAGLHFSFSGVKSALSRLISKTDDSTKSDLGFHADISASYQWAIVESLVQKTILAAKQENAKSLIIAGGVAANSLLRKRMKAAGEQFGFAVHIPSREYCTDNAAMIAMAGLSRFERNDFASLDVSPNPNLSLGQI
ncbi:MAG: tRNA (adenosine(37)-N6)-threonylcarbamoyltransferase complex transferase subunit TsaD [Nitrospirota bacterium]